MKEKLDAMFNKRYGQQIADLNKNVYKSLAIEDGCYEVPVVTLGGGGGTVLPHGEGAVDLAPPALVRLQNKKMKPFNIVYRVAVPFNEAAIAADKPEYFNYLFDTVVAKAIGNYKATVGAEDKVRFGSQYIMVERPGRPSGDVFDVNDDIAEFRFFGSWAGDEEVV